MPFLETVEEGMEAAHELRNTIGDELDPQNEQDQLECQEIGIQDNPEYATRDFTGVTDETEALATPGLFKTIIIKPDEEVFQLIHRMDNDQRMVLDVAIRYIKRILMSRKSPFKFMAPRLIIQGGAGAGKSSVIHVIVQLVEKLLRRPGDNLDNPYILPLSFTGTAAANIDGMTLHSAFNFPFSNEFLSLPDKLRDQKRDFLKNLKMIILDEFSMIKADLLYQMDLRLRELLENTKEPFGGCAIFMFGDILQLRPVMGKYIFELPRSSDYHACFYIESLWKTFGVIQLRTNHRQGEDYDYAEVLNRIRIGAQTENDYELLQARVRPLNHPDIPSDALFVTCLNKHVNEINEQKLEMMEGDHHEIKAIVRSSAQKEVNPKISNDGSICNTTLQKLLKLKVGAKVMLTHNIDVIDSLTNGAFGEIVGFQFTNVGTIKTVLVHFKNEKVGMNKRKNCAFLQHKFSGIPVTPIEKIEYNFSVSKKQTNNKILTALQFPLKLSFACTAHKMQGATVCKPDPLILDLRHVMEPAQAYVMLSRVQALNQLYIIDEIPPKKIYPSPVAIEELSRLKLISNNDTEMNIRKFTVITSLNIRSLPKHINDLRNDYKVRTSKMICIQETWCSDNYDSSHLNIDGFNLHLSNHGNGKGIATYYKNNFQLTGEMNTEKFQMSKFSSNECHVVNVYRSQGADTTSFIENLNKLIVNCYNCYIVGDFNIDYFKNMHPISSWILSQGFQQLVKYSTHEMGSLLDYAFVKSFKKHDIELHCPYYTDHASVCVVELV